jgi:hypothetical protein
MDDRKRLEQVLAAYGADPGRWPEADRRLAHLLGAKDKAAARKIDALLGQASPIAAPSGAQDRLAARLSQSRGNVIAMTPRTPRPRFPSLWAGAALAASLAIGVYLGGTGVADDLMESVAGLDEPLDLIGLGDAEAIAEEDAA